MSSAAETLTSSHEQFSSAVRAWYKRPADALLASAAVWEVQIARLALREDIGDGIQFVVQLPSTIHHA